MNRNRILRLIPAVVAICGLLAVAEIVVAKDDMRVSARSIMGLMMLAAGPGSKVTLHVKGADASNAIAELEALVKRKFDED